MFVVSANYAESDILACAQELFTKYTKARQILECEKEYLEAAETEMDYGKMCLSFTLYRIRPYQQIENNFDPRSSNVPILQSNLRPCRRWELSINYWFVPNQSIDVCLAIGKIWETKSVSKQVVLIIMTCSSKDMQSPKPCFSSWLLIPVFTESIWSTHFVNRKHDWK